MADQDDETTVRVQETESLQDTVATEQTEEAAEVDSPSASVRMCIGCRRTDDREALLRFAIAPMAPYVAADPQRKLGGRGVSVHPTRECITLAVKKGGFARALKRSVTLDVDALCTNAAMQYIQRAESLLIAAARRKMLAMGSDAVREKIWNGSLETLVVATDAEGRREELENAVARLERRCVVFGTKSSLGRLFGRDEVGVLGILDRRIGDEVVRCAAQTVALHVSTALRAETAEAE